MGRKGRLVGLRDHLMGRKDHLVGQKDHLVDLKDHLVGRKGRLVGRKGRHANKAQRLTPLQSLGSRGRGYLKRCHQLRDLCRAATLSLAPVAGNIRQNPLVPR